MEGIDRGQFLETVRQYNAAVQTSVPFDPDSRDGRSTRGLAVNKSNWATTLDQPPFEAFAITAGITFTFGGVKVNTDAQVIDIDDRPIPGLTQRAKCRRFLYELPRAAPGSCRGPCSAKSPARPQRAVPNMKMYNQEFL